MGNYGKAEQALDKAETINIGDAPMSLLLFYLIRAVVYALLDISCEINALRQDN